MADLAGDDQVVVNIHRDDVVIMFHIVILGVGESVHDDADRGSMVDYVIVKIVPEIVTSVITSDAIDVLQIQLLVRLFTAIAVQLVIGRHTILDSP